MVLEDTSMSWMYIPVDARSTSSRSRDLGENGNEKVEGSIMGVVGCRGMFREECVWPVIGTLWIREASPSVSQFCPPRINLPQCNSLKSRSISLNFWTFQELFSRNLLISAWSGKIPFQQRHSLSEGRSGHDWRGCGVFSLRYFWSTSLVQILPLQPQRFLCPQFCNENSPNVNKRGSDTLLAE